MAALPRGRRPASVASPPPETAAEDATPMKPLLLTSLAAVGFVLAVPAAVWACGPCFQPCLVVPVQFEQRTVICYRTECRTELRPVQKTIYHSIPETKIEEVKEKVVVSFWREEERKKDVMVVQEKEETRKHTAFHVECKPEERTRTHFAPQCDEEKRQRTVFWMKNVPEVRTQRFVSYAQVTLPVCDPSTGLLHHVCQKVAQVHTTCEVLYHSMPQPLEQDYKVPVEKYLPQEEKYKAEVIVPTPVEQTCKVPVCEYTAKPETCKVPVLDFREETITHKVPVTNYRSVPETITEMVPCTVNVQVPYEVQVWVPVCPCAPPTGK
jgi:hypothetical protein